MNTILNSKTAKILVVSAIITLFFGCQRKQVQLLWREAMIDYLGKENLEWLLL